MSNATLEKFVETINGDLAFSEEVLESKPVLLRQAKTLLAATKGQQEETGCTQEEKVQKSKSLKVN